MNNKYHWSKGLLATQCKNHIIHLFTILGIWQICIVRIELHCEFLCINLSLIIFFQSAVKFFHDLDIFINTLTLIEQIPRQMWGKCYTSPVVHWPQITEHVIVCAAVLASNRVIVTLAF